jgi:hypothetical protein
VKIRRSTTPEPIHRKTYSTLKIPTEIMKPVKTWLEPSPRRVNEISTACKQAT